MNTGARFTAQAENDLRYVRGFTKKIACGSLKPADREAVKKRLLVLIERIDALGGAA